MIEQSEVQEVGTVLNSFGDHVVSFRRTGISRGMIVHKHKPEGCGHDYGPEDFPGVRDGLVDAADGNHVVTGDPELGVYEDGDQMLLVWLEDLLDSNDLLPKLESSFR